jgi:hypothetical protein
MILKDQPIRGPARSRYGDTYNSAAITRLFCIRLFSPHRPHLPKVRYPNKAIAPEGGYGLQRAGWSCAPHTNLSSLFFSDKSIHSEGVASEC